MEIYKKQTFSQTFSVYFDKRMLRILLLGIISEYYEKTKSLKASKIINNWNAFKGIFKIVVPPSEEEMLGLKN